MERNHHQGRTEARQRALRRAYVRSLLVTLAVICRHLRAQQENPAVRTAYREVEKELRQSARLKS